MMVGSIIGVAFGLALVAAILSGLDSWRVSDIAVVLIALSATIAAALLLFGSL